ncbi:hypothetical protein BC332_25809 [Capsicum chinense]|nr:hypothetical protein BC332_25809 [Capsicum chinense]
METCTCSKPSLSSGWKPAHVQSPGFPGLEFLHPFLLVYKVFGGLHGNDLLISPKDLPSLRKIDIDDKNLGASEHINPFGKIL